ncbi:GH25 family lysozyme [Amaricoccus sp.]|uniref:glycoside hydrolase family 25 protein n=1 Tax=Amaricoccus sp. TaxID=1872485 RepID=UPI001B64B48B|nr:GH25 family lysozyme [Amaricoccus sp.]MBP7242639.1 glycoside hydrolase family 25 protein [Amaricoccus sp.]
MRTLALLACALALVACGSPTPQASRSVTTSAPRFLDYDPHDWTERTPWHYPVHGVDVSKWQGTIDWPRVRASGASFAFIKATEGKDHTDDRFMENWRAAGAAGVPRGAYHFYYFCSSAEEQANWFIRNVPRERGALPPVLDVEWNHKSKTCPYRPAPAIVRAEMETFLAMVARHYGQRPLVYVPPDFFRENDLARMQGVTFWLRSVAGHPSAVYPGQSWGFWQYTGTGQVPGIAGEADLNAFAGGQTEWRAWLARHTL